MDFLLPVLHAVDAGDKLQMLHHGEVIKKARLVRNEREASFGSQRIVPKSELTNADLAARRRNNAGNAAQRRCFARAVWADQPHHLSRFHAKGKIRHGRVGTVDLRQPVDFNQWLAAFPCARGILPTSAVTSPRRNSARRSPNRQTFTIPFAYFASSRLNSGPLSPRRR